MGVTGVGIDNRKGDDICPGIIFHDCQTIGIGQDHIVDLGALEVAVANLPELKPVVAVAGSPNNLEFVGMPAVTIERRLYPGDELPCPIDLDNGIPGVSPVAHVD